MIHDYTQYSLAELQEALSVVDGRRYPENLAAIEAEIQARKDSGAYEREVSAIREEHSARLESELQFAQRSKPLIAWYLIVGGAFFFATFFFGQVTFTGAIGLAILSLGVVYMLATILAGVMILKDHPWGTKAAIGLLGAQLIQFESTAFTYKVSSLISGLFTLEANGVIGASVSFGSKFRILFGEPTVFLVGLNLFAAWLIYLLIRSGERQAT